jgi:hypothetical protein
MSHHAHYVVAVQILHPDVFVEASRLQAEVVLSWNGLGFTRFRKIVLGENRGEISPSVSLPSSALSRLVDKEDRRRVRDSGSI